MHIPEYTVDRINEIISTNLILLTQELNYTVGGRQSDNILEYIPIQILTQFLPSDYAYRTKWIHTIEYAPGGFQKVHTHPHEKYSWILYLDNSDGDTLYHTEKGIRTKPVKGKLVVFSADIPHEGLPCTKHKRVLVGSIDKND